MTEELFYIPTKKYVYYDENGTILSITNRIVSDDPYIEVENSDVKTIINGQDQITNFCVEYDTLTKKYVLKHKKINNKTFISIKDNIFQIPNNAVDDYDLKILRDNINKQWIIELDKELRENLKTTYSNYSNVMHFSITEKNDPNCLLQMITIRVKDLVNNKSLKIKFSKENAFDNKEISVYTVRKFQTYSYEEINE